MIATVAPAVEALSSAQISKTNQKRLESQIVISVLASASKRTRGVAAWQERSSDEKDACDSRESHLGFENFYAALYEWMSRELTLV